MSVAIHQQTAFTNLKNSRVLDAVTVPFIVSLSIGALSYRKPHSAQRLKDAVFRDAIKRTIYFPQSHSYMKNTYKLLNENVIIRSDLICIGSLNILNALQENFHELFSWRVTEFSDSISNCFCKFLLLTNS